MIPIELQKEPAGGGDIHVPLLGFRGIGVIVIEPDGEEHVIRINRDGVYVDGVEVACDG